MRAFLLVLIIVVVALIVAVATGFLDITQTRSAQAPQIGATGNGIVAKGGQSPAFDVETGTVAVGTETRNVAVPTVKVVPPNAQSNTATNTAN